MTSQRLWMERNVKALGLGVITNKSSYFKFRLYLRSFSKAMRDQHVNQRHRFFTRRFLFPIKT